METVHTAVQGTQNSTPHRRRPHNRERADCHGSSNDNPRPAHGSGRRSRTHGSPPHALGQWIGRGQGGGVWLAGSTRPHPPCRLDGASTSCNGKTAPRGRVMRFKNPRHDGAGQDQEYSSLPGGEQTAERRDGLCTRRPGGRSNCRCQAVGWGRRTGNSERQEWVQGVREGWTDTWSNAPPSRGGQGNGREPQKGAYGAESRGLATSSKLGEPRGAGVARGGREYAPPGGQLGKKGKGGRGNGRLRCASLVGEPSCRRERRGCDRGQAIR